MNWLAIIIPILIVAYLYDQYQKQPYKAYDSNVREARENKKELLKNLAKEIEMRYKQLKKNAKTKGLSRYIKELHHLKAIVLPNFEQHFISLNTRYKSDIKKLVEVSDDYREWFYYQARLYDPINYELWNELSYEHQNEAITIIAEINKKLGFEMKLN